MEAPRSWAMEVDILVVVLVAVPKGERRGR
jgi:hypothetical protein